MICQVFIYLILGFYFKFILCEHFLYVQYKIITKKFHGFDNIFSWIFKMIRISNMFGDKFYLSIHKPSLGSCESPQKCSAVLTFIGYKRRDRQTSKVYITINNQSLVTSLNFWSSIKSNS